MTSGAKEEQVREELGKQFSEQKIFLAIEAAKILIKDKLDLPERNKIRFYSCGEDYLDYSDF